MKLHYLIIIIGFTISFGTVGIGHWIRLSQIIRKLTRTVMIKMNIVLWQNFKVDASTTTVNL